MIIKPEINKTYRLYHKYQKTDVCYDVYTTEINIEKITFLISNVFMDDLEGRFTEWMNTDRPMVLMSMDFNLFNAEKLEPFFLKKAGNCPTCGLKGNFVRTALTCRRHGFYAGI